MDQRTMKITCGIDIVHLPRFQELLHKQPSAQYEIFTDQELKIFTTIESRAGIFAAKEAIIKAYKKPLHMNQIEILKHENGTPYISQPTQVLLSVVSTDISIAHDGEYVVASCSFLMQ